MGPTITVLGDESICEELYRVESNERFRNSGEHEIKIFESLFGRMCYVSDPYYWFSILLDSHSIAHWSYPGDDLSSVVQLEGN